ncbi:hypothetical protein YC2023_081619 [Brassica napus]
MHVRLALSSFSPGFPAPKIRNLEAGIWNLEAGTRNLEAGIWNLEAGIWNPEEVEQQCSRRLGRVPFVEQLQRNLTTWTHWWRLGLARLILADYPLILMFVMTAPGWDREYAGTRDCKGHTSRLELEPAGTKDCRGVFWDPSCANFRSEESKSFLAPRWMGLRDFREDTCNVPPTYHIVT